MNLTPPKGFYRWQPAAVLRVLGGDSLTFLQGQFTNDLQQAGNEGALYGLWLNQKGKVLADSFVRKVSASEAWIVSYFSPASVIRERLEAYIIADDVVIEDVTAAMAGVTLDGEATPAELAFGGTAWAFCGRRGREVHTEIIFPISEAPALDDRMRGGTALGLEDMERRRIAAGIPAVPVDIGPGDLPNEGGLEAEAISYTKGCYLGQEVMARLKSMGQVRRRLLKVRGAGEIPPRPAPLFQGERRVGELRSAARDGAEWVGLAMLSLVQLRREDGLSREAGGPVVVKFSDPA